MKNYLYISQNKKGSFPYLSLLIAIVIMIVSPFVSKQLMFFSFVILCLRLLRYDIKVSCVDIAFFIPFSGFFRTTSGIAYIAYYVIIFDIIVLLKKSKIEKNEVFYFLLILSSYLLFRTRSLNIIVFMCSGMLFLYLIFCNRKSIKELLIMKSLVWGTMFSSIYGYILNMLNLLNSFDNTNGLSQGRFQGLFEDPNYYSTFLIFSLICLMLLKDGKELRKSSYILQFLCLTYFGIITASKSFFFMLIAIVVYQFYTLIINRKYKQAFIIVCILILFVMLAFSGKVQLFELLIDRLAYSDNMSDITTGRTDLWKVYYMYILNHIPVLIIGRCLGAPLLQSPGQFDSRVSFLGPHNIYLEILYNLGMVGLILILAFFYSIYKYIKNKERLTTKTSNIRFLPIVSILAMYFFLQGIGSTLFYLSMFVVFVCYKYSLKKCFKTRRRKSNGI